LQIAAEALRSAHAAKLRREVRGSPGGQFPDAPAAAPGAPPRPPSPCRLPGLDGSPDDCSPDGSRAGRSPARRLARGHTCATAPRGRCRGSAGGGPLGEARGPEPRSSRSRRVGTVARL